MPQSEAFALGGGIQLALAHDMRVVTRGTKLGLLEHRYGLIPDLGGTQRLPRLVGRGKVKELIFKAQQIKADEAYRIGLAEQLASQPPLALLYAKRAINTSQKPSVRDGLLLEAKSESVCIRSNDAKEAVRAFMEKQAPQYQGR